MTSRWRRSWTSSASSRLEAALTCPTWPLFRLATSSATILPLLLQLSIVIICLNLAARWSKPKPGWLGGRRRGAQVLGGDVRDRGRQDHQQVLPVDQGDQPGHDHHEYKVNMFPRTEERARATRTSATKRWTWLKRTLACTGDFKQIHCWSQRSKYFVFMKAVTVRITGKTQQTTVDPTQQPQPPLGSITIGEISSTLLISALNFVIISFLLKYQIVTKSFLS